MDPELKQALAEMEQNISASIAELARQTENRFGLLGHEVQELRRTQKRLVSDLGRYAILIGPVASGLGEIHETLGSLRRQISEMSSSLLTQRTVEIQRFVDLSDRVGAIERHIGPPEVAND